MSLPPMCLECVDIDVVLLEDGVVPVEVLVARSVAETIKAMRSVEREAFVVRFDVCSVELGLVSVPSIEERFNLLPPRRGHFDHIVVILPRMLM